MAQWAAKNNIKKVVTLVSDYAPGYDAEKVFGEEFKKNGGEIVANVRVPVQSPDFAPSLQRARDANPDGIFVFMPGNFAGTFARQYAERGLNASGIKLMGTLDLTDDDLLNAMGDAAHRHYHRGSIFRRACFAGKQGVRCRLHQVRRQAAQSHGGIGLRRHAPDL